jgi:6-phosphogluconolactonase (cycloisomerase 2 family)
MSIRIIFNVLIGFIGIFISPSSFSQALEFIGSVKDSSVTIAGLDGIVSIGASPDNKFIYVCGANDNSVVVFQRNADQGDLSFIEVHMDNMAGVDGISSPNSVVISPDGKNAYVAGLGESAIAVFNRNSVTGRITYLASYKDGVNGVDGLRFASCITISPDNKYVYVTGSGEHAIAVFGRDLTTGLLTFIELKKDGVDGVLGLQNPYVSMMSADGKYFYTVGYGSNSIVVFERNETTGSLSFVESQIDNTNGVDGLEGANSLVISTDGKYIYVAGEKDQAIAVFKRDVNTGRITFVEVNKNNTNGISGLEEVSGIAIDAEGDYLYASAYGSSAVFVFSRDHGTGELSYVETLKDNINGVDGIEGAICIAITNDSKNVYVGGMTESSLATFSVNNNNGELSYNKLYKNGLNKIVEGLEGAQSSVISADGRFVYVAGSDANAISLLERNSFDGSLIFVKVYKNNSDGINGLEGCRSITISPDGNYLYVAGLSKHSIAAFRRDKQTGLLTFLSSYINGTAGITGMLLPTSLQVSSDNKNLYVTAFAGGGSLFVFDLDPLSGLLTYSEKHNELSGTSGLKNAVSVKVNHDGRFVYVAGTGDNALTVFNRNASNGKLTFSALYKDTEDEMIGLEKVNSIFLSSDGKFLYTTSDQVNIIALFSINESSGLLSFIETYKNGIEGMAGTVHCIMHPSGKVGFAVNYMSHSITAFIRNQVTGKLHFYKSYKNGESAIVNMEEPLFALISGDGNHLYITSSEGNSIGAFRILNVPLDPVGLTAILDDAKVQLSWTPNMGTLISYNIYRNTSDDPTTAANIGNTILNLYEDEDVNQGLTYYYWITAKNSKGVESALSTSINIYIPLNTGVKPYSQDILASISPNPSDGEFKIEFIDVQNTYLEIRNTLGKLIETVLVNGSSVHLDLTSYPAGLYFVRVLGEDSFQPIKIVKE